MPPLINQGEVTSDNKGKAKILNNFFSSQNNINEGKAPVLDDNFENREDNTIDSIQLTPLEVETCSKSLKTGNAAGPDTINNGSLKEVSGPLSSPLCDLFNYSLTSGYFPKEWKKVNISPIDKKRKDDRSDLSNYRHVSLLSAVGKVLKKLVHERVFKFCCDNSVITDGRTDAGTSTIL